MAKQMEIHPDRNDVINTVESTFLSCMGKPSHAGISANSSVHTCNSIREKRHVNPTKGVRAFYSIPQKQLV